MERIFLFLIHFSICVLLIAVLYALWKLNQFLQISAHHFAVLFAFIGGFIYLTIFFGVESFGIKDPTSLALITYAFAGRSWSNLGRKVENKRSNRPKEKSIKDVNREIHWAIVFLSLGAITSAFLREKRVIERQTNEDWEDNNACANFGGCPAGQESLPEMNIYSVLASTRFFSDMQDSGARWRNRNDSILHQSLDYTSLTIPKIVMSRYRVPKGKTWKYNSTALRISSIKYEIGEYVEESPEIEFSVNPNSSIAVVSIGRSNMSFTLEAMEAKISQTYIKIDLLEEIEESAIKNYNIPYARCHSKDFDSTLARAVEHGFLRKDQISYWKVITGCILLASDEEYDVNIHGLKIHQQLEFFLKKPGEFFTSAFLLLSVIIICVDEIDELEQFADLTELCWDFVLSVSDDNEIDPSVEPMYGSTLS